MQYWFAINPNLFPFTADGDTDSAGDPYIVLLELIDKLFENEYDSTEFEDRLRQIYGTKAYIMFTVDRLAQNLTKQVCTKDFDNEEYCLLVLY